MCKYGRNLEQCWTKEGGGGGDGCAANDRRPRRSPIFVQSNPIVSLISSVTRSGSAAGRSILFSIGIISRLFSNARYTFASVCGGDGRIRIAGFRNKTMMSKIDEMKYFGGGRIFPVVRSFVVRSFVRSRKWVVRNAPPPPHSPARPPTTALPPPPPFPFPRTCQLTCASMP